MIEIKMLSKAKTTASTLSRGAGGSSTSTQTLVASEANHALKADRATEADHATRADAADQSAHATEATKAAMANYALRAGDIDADSATLKAVLQNYLYKAATDEAQTVEGEVIFEQDTTFLSSVVVDRVHDRNSTEADRTIVGAQGFDLYMGTDGKSHLYVDYLTARTKFFASQAEIRKVSYSGGTTLFSNAGSQIAKVAYVYDSEGKNVIAYKCYAAADDGTTQTANWWHVGMMALCQTFNVKAGQTTTDLQNRYYWRLVVGVGQEVLDDGKLYDYVVLSNVKQFQGNTKNVPVYADAVLADDGTLLEWGNVLLAITTNGGSDSLANIFSAQEGRTTDDGGTEVASRLFYGYEPKEDGTEPDAPLPYDVIVQAGDQIRWQSYGNVIKLETSTEDNASDTAPAITMYHKMGAPYGTGSYDESGTEIVNPYQWLTVTALLSPVEVRFNADYYKLFQGTPDNIIDPIVVMHEVVPSTMCLVRDQQTQSCTPSNITFTIRKRTGGKVETMTDTNVKWYASVNGATETLAKTGASITLSEIATPYNVTRLHMRAVLDDEQLAVYDLPVVSNGTNGNDGTSVTIKGKCAAHYANYAAWEADGAPITIGGGVVLLDVDEYDGYQTPTVLTYSGQSYNKAKATLATAGDGYLSADGDLWVAGDSAWTNAGHIKGDQGDQGDPGTDAVDFVVSGTPLVFDTDDSGLIPASDSKTATLQAWQGGKNVTAQLVMAGTADENVSKWAYSGIGTDTVSATIYKVKAQTIDGDSVSCTSGFVMMTFTYNGVSYPVSIPFSVNVSKFNHTVYSTAKESIDKYTEVSTDVKTAQQTADDAKTAAGKAQTTADGAQSSADKAQTSADNAQSAADQAQADADTANNAIADIPIKTPAELTQYTSEIKQTAREISLEVQSETVGRRNMLTGSGLTKQDGWSYMSGGALCSERPAERIEIASGMDGTPAMRCRTVQTAASSYVLSGMHWVGNSPQGNVRIEKGKTYVLSFWGKAVDKDAVEFVAEAIWQGSLTDTSRPAGYKGPVNFSTVFTPTASGAWERHDVVLTVPATASYDYVEVCLFARAKGYTVTEAYLCRPMLEEAAAYNGWTLSEHDYDYVGGNMLDNTASLLVGDNLKLQNGTRIDGGYDGDTTYVLATIDSTAADKYTEVLQWSTEDMGITALSDYVLSFVAKGSGELHTYLYPSTAYNHSENSQGDVQDNTDGHSYITLTQEWRRYWVHWKPQGADQTNVLMRLMRPSGGTSTLYIAQPKLERGAVRTAWTERKTDLIDRQTLRQAGISITSDTVELYGDQIKVSETKGGTPTAMFKDGKLSASLIDAETIVVDGLQGKTINAENATISNLNVTGEINATGGTVGGFTIEKSQMTGQGEEGNVNMTLCPSYVHYVDSSMGIDASFGALKSLFDNSITYCAWMTSEKNWPTKLVGPYGNYTEQQLNIGLYVSASGTMHKLSRDSTLNYHNGNHAILCPKGDYAGFRPYMRRIIGSQTLSPYDVMLEVLETYTAHNDAKDTDTTYTVGAVTLTLPTDPELGQLYWILRPTKYDTTVKTADGSKIAYPTGVGTEVTLNTQNEMVWIVWTGEYWRMMWRMGVA